MHKRPTPADLMMLQLPVDVQRTKHVLRRCSWALLAQFYPKKYPANVPVLVFCLVAYGACTIVLNLYLTYKAGDSFFFATPQQVCNWLAGLRVVRVGCLPHAWTCNQIVVVGVQGGHGGEVRLSSSLPRYSHMYKLTIHSADLSASKR